MQVCLDVLGVGVSGERDAVFELAGLARLPAEDSLALLLNCISPEMTSSESRISTLTSLRFTPGSLRFDDPGIVGLLDVGDWRPRAAVATSGR